MQDVRCAQFREAMSAGLDGEEPGIADAQIDAHVAGCAGCEAWRADATAMHRLTRLAPAQHVPDLTATVLAAVARQRRQPSFTALVARAGLAAVALAQAVLAVPALIAAQDSLDAPTHVAHESGAWNAAVAIGFLAVVLRPRLAAGLLPLLAAFVAILVAVTVPDLAAGHVDADRVLAHLLMLAGVVLLTVLTVLDRPRGGSGTPAGGRRRQRALRRAAARSWAAVSDVGPGIAGGARLRSTDPAAGSAAARDAA